MSIIIRNGGKSRRNDKNQIYTWVACGLVFVFAISILVAVKNSGPKSESQEAYRKQAFDLGNMPFSDDSAEQYLLASNKYNDIAKNDLINGLFSKKQKEERQEDDKLNGVPAAPDEEYAAAQKAMEAKKKRATKPRKAASKPAPVKTSRSSLSGRSMVTASGGGGGTRGTVWGAPNTQRIASSNNQAQKAALMAQVKGAKTMGLQHAAQASAAAANANDMESAAAGAVDAFQKGSTEESKEFLEGELENNADALNVDEGDLKEKLERAGNSEDLEGLDTKLEDKKKEKDEEDEENCDAGPFSSGACFGSAMFDLGKSLLMAYVTGLF